MTCNNYKPDHNGECLNCDEPASEHEDTYQYQEQDGTTVTMTRSEILKHYYPYWSEQMKKVHKEHLINEDNCVDDWVIVNWAVKKGVT